MVKQPLLTVMHFIYIKEREEEESKRKKMNVKIGSKSGGGKEENSLLKSQERNK